METEELALLATAPSTSLLQRLMRCMGVSVISTTISLTVLATATLAFGVAAWTANVIAVACATGPSYTLNRRWTWGRRDPSHPWREVMPFWAMSFAGLGLSTILVGITGAWAASMHLVQPFATLSLLGAHMSGFALLWGVQFVVLDRVLFGGARSGVDAVERGCVVVQHPADVGVG